MLRAMAVAAGDGNFNEGDSPKYTFAGFCIDGNKTKLERVNLEVTNFIDIQKEWRVPESTKELDSLADVAGMLVDDY
ncbi:hypothetical protein D1007_32509 [Hordeum vulgare]|nr:hypothetical protein D1007_32509 [Hordeum vulgare]